MARRKLVNPHLDIPPQEVKVEVRASGDPVQYTVVIKSFAAKLRKKKKRLTGHADPIKLPKDSGAYRIGFKLVTRLDLRFDAAGPFLCDVTYGDLCPTSLNRIQFLVESCDDDELVVMDWNFGAGADFHYQLNFINSAGVPQPPCDPIIINGGGIKR